MVEHLVDRRPEVSSEDLVAGLVPPPLFQGVSFATYHPDPDQPTQAAAVDVLRGFADRVAAPPRPGFFRRRGAPVSPGGIYLDGGFGVGKTHLLASLWRAVPPPRAYATFVELTHLAGALGFPATVDALAGMRLLAIDEFELDDPGDTVLASTLLARLTERGVALAATSNTLPEALGEGRFASADFAREIQGLADHFTTVRVDGPDYRHRGRPLPGPARTDAELDPLLAALGSESPGRRITVDDADELAAHLMRLHPSRYGALIDGVDVVALRGVHAAPEEASALRMVVLTDRLYDRQIPLLGSGRPLPELFTDEMLAGGYRKKYLRATSRLLALGRLGDALAAEGVGRAGELRQVGEADRVDGR
ncbi:MAG: cell division protein ZapE [bacterium]